MKDSPLQKLKSFVLKTIIWVQRVQIQTPYSQRFRINAAKVWKKGAVLAIGHGAKDV
jgi:hypothetical protein